MTPGPPPVPGGRSDDERERARIEREARRSGASTAAGRRANGAARLQNGPRPSERRFAPSEGRGPRRPRGPRPPRQQNFRTRRIFLAIGALVLLAALWFLFSLFQPFAGSGGATRTVTIKPNSSVGDIASQLAKEGIVSNGFFFELRATLSGKRGALKPGTYTLREDMPFEDTIAALEKGPPPNTVKISVPEGRSRGEIAKSISGLRGDYLKATKRSAALDPRDYGAKNAKNLEGFLWPATYELKRGQPVKLLVDKQLVAFKDNFSTVSMSRAKSKNLTRYEVLTIASLVERETAVPRERKLIASVIYNRLSQDQSLGIDATVRFILDKWDGALTQSDLNTDSPYNTRKFKGLPPGPIGNPGLASIKAAAKPANTDYLFYVANPCKPGTHTFTKTLAEFNAAAAKYNAARDAAGGKAPKGC
jgi:uncharacterized YceG family protein